MLPLLAQTIDAVCLAQVEAPFEVKAAAADDVAPGKDSTDDKLEAVQHRLEQISHVLQALYRCSDEHMMVVPAQGAVQVLTAATGACSISHTMWVPPYHAAVPCSAVQVCRSTCDPIEGTLHLFQFTVACHAQLAAITLRSISACHSRTIKSTCLRQGDDVPAAVSYKGWLHREQALADNWRAMTELGSAGSVEASPSAQLVSCHQLCLLHETCPCNQVLVTLLLGLLCNMAVCPDMARPMAAGTGQCQGGECHAATQAGGGSGMSD